jgi:hypothetical protein
LALECRRIERRSAQSATTYQAKRSIHRRLIPVCLRQQEDPDIGTQTTADISQKEVQPIERRAIEHEA